MRIGFKEVDAELNLKEFAITVLASAIIISAPFVIKSILLLFF